MPFTRRPKPQFKGIIHWFSLWLPLFMLLSIPLLTNWLKNSAEDTLQDLSIPFILVALTATLTTCIFYRRFKVEPFKTFFAALLSLLVLGQNYGDRLNLVNPLLKILNPFPQIQDWLGMILSLVFDLLVILLAIWLSRKVNQFIQRKGWKAADFRGGLTIIIAVTFFIQAYTTVKTVVIEWPQFFYRPAPIPGKTTVSSKPDIYYIVLDRYASQDVLTSQFNFDNSDFLSFLEQHGFSANPNAHQNYPYTTMSISSTLNADYHTDTIEKFSQLSKQTVEPYHDSIRYSSVIEKLKDIGYSYYHIGSWYEASNQAPLADYYYQQEGQLTIFGHQYTLNNFSKNEVLKSLYAPFLQHGIKWGNFPLFVYGGQEGGDMIKSDIGTLKDIASKPSGGRFVFAHILIPHDPYIFNADGSRNQNADSNDNGEPIKQKYVNQVEYINSQMKDVVTKINQDSNNQAVIIIQSDEGPYPTQLNDEDFNLKGVDDELSTGDMGAWSDQDLAMKYGILAAYHIPQATPQALQDGGNSVNIFRVVFNTYFGMNLPYLPECIYGYSGGRSQPFNYTDFTQRITGTANPLCPVDSDFNKK